MPRGIFHQITHRIRHDQIVQHAHIEGFRWRQDFYTWLGRSRMDRYQHNRREGLAQLSHVVRNIWRTFKGTTRVCGSSHVLKPSWCTTGSHNESTYRIWSRSSRTRRELFPDWGQSRTNFSGNDSNMVYFVALGISSFRSRWRNRTRLREDGVRERRWRDDMLKEYIDHELSCYGSLCYVFDSLSEDTDKSGV